MEEAVQKEDKGRSPRAIWSFVATAFVENLLVGMRNGDPSCRKFHVMFVHVIVLLH
jgi:hypothetical protein